MSLDLKTNFPQINLSLVKGRSCLVYTFDNFKLEAEHLMLYRDGEEVSLTPKQVETLLALVEKDGEIVSKETLMFRLWGDASVEESNLIQNIHVLRKVLGETSVGKPMIETLRRRGYRFNGELKVSANGGVQAKIVGTSHRAVEADPPELSKVTRRRKGLLRGSKFLLLGLGIGFVFLVLLRALMIFGVMLSEYKNSNPAITANSTQDMMGDLLVMVFIPAIIGMFSGIGLSLFGIGRVAYAVFEKENSKIRSRIVERVLAGVIVLLLLSIAIPNLLYSFREATRVRKINQASTERRFVAVLPLKPLDAGAREEIYEFGIAESVNAKINAVSGFLARSLSSSIQRRYAELEKDPFAVGRDMKVDYVLDSHYRVADGQIIVTSQLLNVASGAVEDTFEASADSANMITAQDQIATSIADRFVTRFGSRVAKSKEKGGTSNQEAFGAYLQAMNLSEERGLPNLMKSLEYLDRAVALDPSYAQAWAAKASVHADIVGHTDSNQRANYESSMEAIRKAREIDPNLSEAFSALCQNKNRYEYDVNGADAACKRAIELDPNSPVAHKTYATFLYSHARFDEAIGHIKTAMDLQPVSYRNQQMYALTLYFARRYPEAEVKFKTLLELNQNQSSFIYGKLIDVLQVQQGKDAEAFAYLISKLTVDQVPAEKIERLKTVYKTSGWLAVVAERIKEYEAVGGATNFQMACLSANIDDKDKAFGYLEKAFTEHSYKMAVLSVEPQLDKLRDDPRFADLLRRVEGHSDSAAVY